MDERCIVNGIWMELKSGKTGMTSVEHEHIHMHVMFGVCWRIYIYIYEFAKGFVVLKCNKLFRKHASGEIGKLGRSKGWNLIVTQEYFS